MMSDIELRDLGEDIKRNGLKQPIIFQDTDGEEEEVLLDGRNRLEAMERAGLLGGYIDKQYRQGDPVAHIIGLNIRRRHLTKMERADLIVAAVKASKEAKAKPRQLGEVSGRASSAPTSVTPTPEVPPKGGRGKVNETKAKAVAVAKEHGIAERTIERSIAKAEGRLPEPSRIAGPKLSSKPKLEKHVGIYAARNFYLECCAKPEVDLDHERELILEAFQELAGKRAMSATPTTMPPLPDFLDRRQR
jgi:hypothetical protein